MIDPVQLALTQKQLDHIARQMGWVMMKTARSPIFSQSHDFSCFIGDASGAVAAQADGIPIHTGGGGFAMRAIKAAFGATIADGDVFLSNDPYLAGNNHLADWTLIRPVFVDGELLGFACNRAHQSDIGGGAAGTYNAAAREIFHEGVRIPPLRIAERGVLREDVIGLLVANTRCPDLVAGDLHAMLGSTRIGAERLCALAADTGIEGALRLLPELLDWAERRMRAEVSTLKAGCYHGTDASDHDCFGAADVRVKVALTVAQDRLVFDFTGSSAQIAGFKNSPLANTHSAVYLAVATFFDAALPRNEGTYRAIEIVAPEGSVVNARFPAPVGFATTHPAHEIITACWQALAGLRRGTVAPAGASRCIPLRQAPRSKAPFSYFIIGSAIRPQGPSGNGTALTCSGPSTRLAGSFCRMSRISSSPIRCGSSVRSFAPTQVVPEPCAAGLACTIKRLSSFRPR